MASTFYVSISVDNAADMVRKAVEDGSITGEMIDNYKISSKDGSCRVMVFEKHYYRAGNRLTLTVTIDNFEGKTRVHSVSGGGGEGLFRFDWGASEAFSSIAQESLSDYLI